jgi:hypothetical protein
MEGLCDGRRLPTFEPFLPMELKYDEITSKQDIKRKKNKRKIKRLISFAPYGD